MNLRKLLEDEATALPGIQVTLAPDGSIGWARAGRLVAVVAGDGSSAEFALDAAVADAASRTPDVQPSGRGPGWVTFTPPGEQDLDDHGADRAAAWFASAYRRAEPRH